MSCSQKNEEVSNSINIRKELGFIDKTMQVKSQLKRSFFSENGFCYTQIDLYEDSTFFKRNGCESHLHFSLGKWKIYNNYLILNYTSLDKLNMIVNYSLKGNENPFFVLKILNQNQLPIENFEVIGFRKNVAKKTSLKYGLLLTNKQGVIKLRKTDFDSISICGFKNISNKILTLKYAMFPDTLNMMLLFNCTNFCQMPTYDYYKDSSVYYIQNDKLISVQRKKY
ncbi:hypothetical protein BSYN_14150 [Bacteroides sedimenti]|uniref:Lipoprotein n=1 Tax=Bacteroides sedimenti TaxID=2136147 RepID=A0ABN6Z3N9_9BACE